MACEVRRWSNCSYDRFSAVSEAGNNDLTMRSKRARKPIPPPMQVQCPQPAKADIRAQTATSGVDPLLT